MRSAYFRSWYLKNKAKKLAATKAWRAANKARNTKTQAAYSKVWRSTHRDAVARSGRTYRAKHPDKIRKLKRDYQKSRRSKDPAFKLLGNLRSRVRIALKHGRGAKSATTLELLGCTIEQLKLHLESQFQPGMSWDNYGEWHVDHKRPCASFDLADSEQQRVCFHWTNLQPLWGTANIKKGTKWDVPYQHQETRRSKST